MKYRKKPVEVDAWLIGSLLKHASNSWKELPKEVSDAYENGIFVFCPDKLFIKTLEGTMEGSPTDYLIMGVKGEFYPCRDDIFKETYTPVLPIDPEFFKARVGPSLAEQLEAIMADEESEKDP